MSSKKIAFQLCLVLGVFTCCLTDTVKRSAVLDLNGKYSVDWEVDFDTETVVFTVDVETTGYVGFGISPGPSMAGADIVIGGVRDGQTYFDDYFAETNGTPKRDESQDWNLINATESNGRTYLQFSRKLNTCDNVGDVAITADTQYLIWAIGDTDVIGYHGRDPNNRGPKIINLLDAPTPAADLSEFDVFSIRRNHELLPQETSYWCTVHRYPDFNAKHHVVAFNATLLSDMAIKYSHHLVVYGCTPPEGQTTDYFEQFVGHPGGECYVAAPVIPSHFCTNVLYIWAVGGEIMVLPEMTGFPVGDTGRPEYVIFELHVDNPGLDIGTFETGIDMFYTSNLREIDAAVLGVAHAVNHNQIIPARTDNFMNVAHCSSECTAEHIPEEGMTLINVMFHAHKAGKKMRARIIRDGVELPWLAVDNHYNFDYQANRPFAEYRKVMPGDHIITECTYDTTTRPNVTLGGLASMDEMCQAWFWHYPKETLIYCDSTSDPDIKELFGVEDYDASEHFFDPIITKPDQLAGKKYSEHLNTLDWTDELKNRLQQEVVYGKHKGRCQGPWQPLAYPEIKEEYVEEDVCSGSGRIDAKFLILFSALISLFIKMLNSFH